MQLLPDGEADVRTFHNAVDRALTALASAISPASATSIMYTSHMHQSAFHLAGDGCYTRTFSIKPPTSTETLELDSRLKLWYAALPDSIRNLTPGESWFGFAELKLYWRQPILCIILHCRTSSSVRSRSCPWAEDAPQNSLNPPPQPRWYRPSCALTPRAPQSFPDAYAEPPRSVVRVTRPLPRLCASFLPMIALNSDLGAQRRSVWEGKLAWRGATLASLRSVDPLAERCLLIIDRLTPLSGAVQDLDAIVNLPRSSSWFLPGSESIEQWLPLADFAWLNSFRPTAAEA